MEGYVDLSRLIDPIIDLEDLGRELDPEQLAEVFSSCMKNSSYVKRFLRKLSDTDFGWIQDSIKEIIIEDQENVF